MMNESPLVSVIVLSYNSARFVEETLESILRQDYENIQLIVSDDCSTDDTVSICSAWLLKNRSQFSDTVLVTTPVNTGVAGNCNRGLARAGGEWLKFIAADDLLFENCLSEYIRNTGRSRSRFLFSYPSVLVSDGDQARKYAMETYYESVDGFYSLPAGKQFKYLLVNQIPVNPPTLFCHRETLLSMNGFNEQYKCEDLPMYLEATYRGHRFSIVKQKLVGYRLHSAQLSSRNQTSTVNEFWLHEQARIKSKYFTVRTILQDPLLYLEYQLEFASKMVNARLGNKRSFRKVLDLLRALKSRVAFSYIRN